MARGDSFDRFECPFPPCSRGWWAHRDNFRVPGHLPAGEAAEPWIGTVAQNEECPGSNVLIGEVSREVIDDADRAKLDRAMQQWRLAVQIKEHLPEIEQARRNKDLPKHPFIGFPLGGHKYEPTPEAFPGRPADAAEPGPGDAPDKIKPMNQIGYPLGRAAMENAHATTRNLLALTVLKVDEANAVLNKLRAVLDIVDGLCNELSTHTEAAAALCTATVGMGDTAPKSAGLMANFIQDARGRASVVEGGPLIASVTAVSRQVHNTTASLLGAMEAAQEFNRKLS